MRSRNEGIQLALGSLVSKVIQVAEILDGFSLKRIAVLTGAHGRSRALTGGYFGTLHVTPGSLGLVGRGRDVFANLGERPSESLEDAPGVALTPLGYARKDRSIRRVS